MRYGLVMDDIVWPGGAPIPPSGQPDRAFLKIGTLEEKPYVIYQESNPDGQCDEHAVRIRIYNRDEDKKMWVEFAMNKNISNLVIIPNYPISPLEIKYFQYM